MLAAGASRLTGLIGLTAFSLLAWPLSVSSAAFPVSTPRPVEPSLQTIPLNAPEMRAAAKHATPIRPEQLADSSADGLVGESDDVVVATDEIEVEPFRLVAVTWASEHDVEAWVRTRSDRGWSLWYALHGEDEHGPNQGEREGQSRSGTYPLIVPSSDAVQVRVATSDDAVPEGLRLDLIDPGESPADVVSAQAEATATPAVGIRPAIYERAQWGADESLREPGPPEYGVVNGAFIHHTVNANSYSADEVPAIIRSIYAYHVTSRGWRDIGYNFLVDRFGRIWEGRYGGMARPVIGAHTAGYNDDAFGVSAIGTHTSEPPSPSLINSVQQLVAWKFAVHGVDPELPADYDGETWPTIAGHRDAAATECPGAMLYANLPSIRNAVIALTPEAFPHGWGWRDFDGDRLSDLIARRKSDAALVLWPGQMLGGYGQPRQIGSGWGAMNAIVRPGDWDGDGLPDLIARVHSTGALLLYSGNGQGGLRAPRQIGSGWGNITRILTPGDWNGDGLADLIATFQDGIMMLYPGRSGGGFGSPSRIGHGWATHKLAAPGDWNGDLTADLLAIGPDHTMRLYPGNGAGGFKTPAEIGWGWNNFAAIAGAGDADNDAFADLLAWTPGGEMWLFSGNGQGRFGSSGQIATGWTNFDQAN